MLRISTSSAKPNYTTLHMFQQDINSSTMTIPSYQTDLGHLALTRKPTDFRSANRNISLIVPVSLGDTPTQPPRITTRASDIALAADPQATSETTDPYLAHEVIRMVQEQQNNYNKYRNASTALKNYILNAVDDEYIKTLKHKVTRYAKVTQPATHTFMENIWRGVNSWPKKKIYEWRYSEIHLTPSITFSSNLKKAKNSLRKMTKTPQTCY